MDEPTIATERLVLRRHRTEDHPALAAMWSDAAVVRHIGGRPATGVESRARLHRYLDHWERNGFGLFAVVERATGRYLGDVGAADFGRGIAGFGTLPEMGWVFVADVHGRGVAGEAVRAVLGWLDPGYGAGGTECMIAPAAAPSRRLAARLGYRETGAAMHGVRPVVLYRRAAGATFDAPSGLIRDDGP